MILDYPWLACRSRGSARYCVDDGAIDDACGVRARRQAGDERLEPLEALVEQAPQLRERVGVVVDAQVERRVALRRHDPQRRGLLAALVAAGGFTGVHRREQAFGERQLRVPAKRVRRVLDDARTCEHVAGDGKPLVGDVTAPVDALAARVRRGDAARADQVHLPHVASVIAGDEPLDDARRVASLCEQVETGGPEAGIDERLGRERTDTRACVGAQRTDGEKPARDGDPEGTAVIARDDRPRHGVPRR